MDARRLSVGLLLALLAATVAVAGTTNAVQVDGDAVPAFEEVRAGTHPFDADSDGDGLDDGAELEAGTGARTPDTDRDGLGDGPEVHEHGTDPAADDTDGDGLGDWAELAELETDPTSKDTDDDGLHDDREVDEHGTDPAAADTDGDGLRDGREARGLGSDPTAADTDGDGLDDPREVDELGTDPGSTDTDYDSLTDDEEVAGLGTDPTASDTDGDGLGDGLEAAADGPLSAGNPLRMDVFVEVDYMAGKEPSPAAMSAVQDAFASAPVENPDGSTGVTLHVVVDDEVPAEPRTVYRDVDRLRQAHFDHVAQGYHYAVSVTDSWSDDASVGGFSPRHGSFVFQTETPSGSLQYSTGIEARIFMHELGHSLGLTTDDFDGIDSRLVPFEEYPSVMNYNRPTEFVGYHDGEPFDDWAYIETELYTPSTTRATT